MVSKMKILIILVIVIFGMLICLYYVSMSKGEIYSTE